MKRQGINWKKDSSRWSLLCFSSLNNKPRTRFQDLFSRLTFGIITQTRLSDTSRKRTETQSPPRLSIAYQFERAAKVVEDAVSRGDAIQSLHRQTAQQLDATEYALHRLFDEIHSVLPRFEKPVYANAIARTGEAEPFRPRALAA